MKLHWWNTHVTNATIADSEVKVTQDHHFWPKKFAFSLKVTFKFLFSLQICKILNETRDEVTLLLHAFLTGKNIGDSEVSITQDHNFFDFRNFFYLQLFPSFCFLSSYARLLNGNSNEYFNKTCHEVACMEHECHDSYFRWPSPRDVVS